MCYYLGIEDLAANALIAAIQANQKPLFFSFKKLDEYGTRVVRSLMETGKEAVLVLSRELTDVFFHEYSGIFCRHTEKGEAGVALCEGVETSVLVRMFQGSLPLEMLMAFISSEALEALGLAA